MQGEGQAPRGERDPLSDQRTANMRVKGEQRKVAHQRHSAVRLRWEQTLLRGPSPDLRRGLADSRAQSSRPEGHTFSSGVQAGGLRRRQVAPEPGLCRRAVALPPGPGWASTLLDRHRGACHSTEIMLTGFRKRPKGTSGITRSKYVHGKETQLCGSHCGLDGVTEVRFTLQPDTA